MRTMYWVPLQATLVPITGMEHEVLGAKVLQDTMARRELLRAMGTG
jgi:hypothetical protein